MKITVNLRAVSLIAAALCTAVSAQATVSTSAAPASAPLAQAQVAEPASAPQATAQTPAPTGPAQAYAGQEIIFKCAVSGESAPTGYVWRFKSGGEIIERKTGAPQIAIKLEKTGVYAVTCDVTEANRAFASHPVSVRILPAQIAVKAGGPYRAMLNKPVKVHGNAKVNIGKIARYEWFFTSAPQPDWSSAENGAAQYIYAGSGAFMAIFKVTLADGSSAADTAVVNVGSLMPTASAGGTVVSYPGRKVKLNGTGKSPDGKIVKYEWDFDGSGAYGWSSNKSGEAVYAFKAYSYPVLRVTDTEGNTATDTARVVICPANMATVEKGKFCIDKYEWPNIRGGAPVTNISWQEAAKTCESVGKRLCGTDEWQRACRGGRSQNEAGPGAFPYGGKAFDYTKCNTLGNPRVSNSLAASGKFNRCAGSIAAFDMSGNAAEWTASPDSASAPAFGGFYQSGSDASSCDSYLTLEKGKEYLYVGFRCCK